MKNKVKKNNKKSILWVALFLVAVIIGFVISIINFQGTKAKERYVYLNLNFTYANAAKHQMPNGEVLTLDGIMKDEIISSALKKNGLSNNYTTEQIRKNLVVSGVYPNDVIGRIDKYDSLYDFTTSREVQAEDIFPTVYTVKLYDCFNPDASNAELRKILESLAECYREYFYKNCVYSYSSNLELAIYNMDELDYSQQIEALYGRMDLLRGYAKMLYEEEPNFRSKGASFNDIIIKLADVSSADLDNINALAIMKAYSKKPERLKSLYQYKIDMLENEEKQYRDSIDSIDKLLEDYHMDDILYVGSGDSVIKVDSNSVGTYEELMSQKIALNDRMIVTASKIAEQEQKLKDIRNAGYTDAEVKNFEDSLLKISSRIDDIESEFVELLKSYNAYIIGSDGMTVGSSYLVAPKVLSGSFVKIYIKFSLPIFLVMFIMISGRMLFVEIKRNHNGY